MSPFKETVSHFLGYTSLHGLGRVEGAKYWLQKGLWLVLFLGSSGMCAYQVFRLAQQYQNFQVNTKTDISSGTQEFPGVSICNMNPILYEYIDDEPYLLSIVKALSNYYNVPLSGFDTENGTNHSIITTTYPYVISPVDTTNQARSVFRLFLQSMKSLEEKTQDFSDFVISCKMNGEPCVEEFVSDTPKFYDSFCNMYLVSRPDFLKGSKLNFNVRSVRITTYLPGIKRASGELTGTLPDEFYQSHLKCLEMILNVDQDNYVPFITESVGVKINVHDIDYHPQVALLGEGYPVGFEVNIGLHKKVNKRIPGPNEKCDRENSYTNIQTCLSACLHHIVAEKCMCASEYLNIDTDDGLYICESTTEFKCMNDVLQFSDVEWNCPHCKQPCKQNTYEKTVSLTTWPARKFEPILKAILGVDPGDAREHLMLLRVFFSDLLTETITEEPAYTDENFVSDIGGQLGLWIGMSVLSLAEVIELLCLLVGTCLKSRKTDSVSSFS